MNWRTLAQDLRYTLCGLRSNPGFAAAAVISIAIGIGVNTAIFSVVNALLLTPLPYADPERLVILWNRSPGLNIAEDWFSTAQFFDIKEGHSGFEQVAIAIGGNQNLTGPFEPERVGVLRVSSNLLPMLGARVHMGRLFVAQEDAPGKASVAVLSHGSWRRRYGADPGAIGKVIHLNGAPHEIVGVLAEGFSLPREVLPTLGTAEDGEIYLPLPLGPSAATTRDGEDYNILAKLKLGVTAQEAQAEMDGITRRLRADHPDVYPENGGLTFGVVPLLDQVVGKVRPALMALLGSVGFVLLIACTNVANLMLSRGLGREKEFAVRIALGASRLRLSLQLIVESLTLAFMGGVLGVAFAVGALRFIQITKPPNIPRLSSIFLDGNVLMFTVLLCVAAGLLFGLAPALSARHLNPAETLLVAGRGATGGSPVLGRGFGLRRLLVVAEISMAVVLLVEAGLLIKAMNRLQNVAPGFDPSGVLTLELTLTGPRYSDAEVVRATYRDLWSRLQALPGVTAAGGVSSLPLSGFFAWGPITIEGRTPPPGENFINADLRVAGGRYFEALGIPLLKGRFFNEEDTLAKDRVIIVDEFMAAQYWPQENPIGKRVRFGDLKSQAPYRTVVGVVGRVKQYGLDEDGRIALYVPQTQSGTRAMYVAVRTTADPAGLAAPVKARIQAIDPDLPVYRVRTMTSWVDQSLSRVRFGMMLVSTFAGVALALASIGVYGVMSFLVGQSRKDLGIRIALGATEGALLSHVLRQGMALVLIGGAVGVSLALAVRRVVGGLLANMGDADALSFGVPLLVLCGVALIAVYVPARRAARVDPIESLRTE